MSGPQKENGYTPIANELLEAICASPFNSTQLKILLFILRYTYGFSRKEHKMSLNFIARGTGISKRYVSSELKRLVEANVIEIVREHTDMEARTLKLNKHYKKWECRDVPQVKNTSTGEAEQDTTGEEFITTPGEESFYQDKQNIKQNLKQAHALFNNLWNQYPRKRGKGQVSESQKKKLLKVGGEQMERCVKRYIRDMEKEGRPLEKYMYGSTFFNSGYVDYLDENFQEQEQPKPQAWMTRREQVERGLLS